MSGSQRRCERAWCGRGVPEEAKWLPCLWLAAELAGVWLISPPRGMIHSKENWQGCFSNAPGVCLSRQNAPRMPTKRPRGVAVNCRGLLPRSCCVRASSSLFGGAVRHVAAANQPKGSPRESEGSHVAKSRLPLQVVPCRLPTRTFLL